MPTSMRYNRLRETQRISSFMTHHLADYLEKFISDEEKEQVISFSSDVALERLAEFSTKGKMLRGIL